MMQLAVLHQLYDGKNLFSFESSGGASIKKLVDGYIALTYPREWTGVGPGSHEFDKWMRSRRKNQR
jgi:hypothetical protein